MKLGFTVNQHDADGDVTDNCILIHINDTTILRFESFVAYEMFISQLESMKSEIKANL